MSDATYQLNSIKDRIRTNFDASTHSYENEADVQRSVAGRLAASLTPWKMTLPPGPILELGAGTGFFTRELQTLFPERSIEVTDLSEKMIRTCRRVIPESDHLAFRTLDAENWNPPECEYALISGNFVAQWFRDPAQTLDRYVDALKPGGLLLASFPAHESFPEWKELCQDLGLPFTRNALPNTEEMVIKLSTRGVQVDYYEDSHSIRFDRSIDFFRHLKKIGASTSTSGTDRKLTPKQFRLLTRQWDQRSTSVVQVTYHLVFLAVKRDYD